MSSIYCYKQSTDTRRDKAGCRIKKKNAIFWLDVGGHAEIFFLSHGDVLFYKY